MAARPHSDLKRMFTGKVNSSHQVCRIGAPDNHSRMFVAGWIDAGYPAAES